MRRAVRDISVNWAASFYARSGAICDDVLGVSIFMADRGSPEPMLLDRDDRTLSKTSVHRCTVVDHSAANPLGMSNARMRETLKRRHVRDGLFNRSIREPFSEARLVKRWGGSVPSAALSLTGARVV
ncbi:unnamed protein product, partial [Iphiclides podalirius]